MNSQEQEMYSFYLVHFISRCMPWKRFEYKIVKTKFETIHYSNELLTGFIK